LFPEHLQKIFSRFLPQFITLSGEISNIFPAYSIEFKHVVTFSGATK
jgi:hypothetical protein